MTAPTNRSKSTAAAKATVPTWGTLKAHGNPTALVYFGDNRRKPNAVGVRVTVERTDSYVGCKLTNVDTGDIMLTGGAATRFWAAPDAAPAKPAAKSAAKPASKPASKPAADKPAAGTAPRDGVKRCGSCGETKNITSFPTTSLNGVPRAIRGDECRACRSERTGTPKRAAKTADAPAAPAAKTTAARKSAARKPAATVKTAARKTAARR
jgi:hypothetical protein